jgi:hypothetical protein
VAWGVAGWLYCRSVATAIPTRGGGGKQVAGRESERRRGEPSSTRVSSELSRVSSELARVSSELLTLKPARKDIWDS